jgi:hypothetical protein
MKESRVLVHKRFVSLLIPENIANKAIQLIEKVKHSSEIVRQLPPDRQIPVRESYAAALRAVFIMAACCTFAAYLVRLPVRTLQSSV